jgi:uncharacterized protein (DUF58 family)
MGRFPIKVASLGKQIDMISKSMDIDNAQSIGEGYFNFFKGSGLEFKGYREYTLSDDSKNIDWKASLRSDKVLVKEFFREKGIDVIFVYDVSDSMLFGSEKKVKAHYGAEFILTLAGTAIESNYNVGLICFSDEIKKSFLPASGQNQVGLFFDVLGNHSTYGGKFDLTDTLMYIDANFTPGSIIILVSDFLGNKIPFNKFENKFKQISKKFDFITVLLRDPRDEFMPSDNMDIVVSDLDGRGELLFNTKKIKKKYEEYSKKQREQLVKFLLDVRSECFELYTNKSYVEESLAFFKRRKYY